jgi:glycosyltransferase involved in cell wall biosynthesis
MKPRMTMICTVPQTFGTLLAGQPRTLSKNFEVTLICAPGPELDDLRIREGVAICAVGLTRRITPVADLIALRRLYLELRDNRPVLLQTYTPKAGLLGQIAGLLARVPIRVHGVVGMPLMEARGVRRWIIVLTEKLTYALSTDLTANSLGLRTWIQSNLGRREVTVIGSGSINGIDISQFKPCSDLEKREGRAALAINDDDVAFLFVGRLVRDKGIEELIVAFTRLVKDQPRARLVLVGDTEPELDPLPPWVIEVIKQHQAISSHGWVQDVRPFYRAADVVVLPSYREGLPNALLEASAMSIPAVTSDISGCNEVVVGNVTGLLVQPKNSGELEEAMAKLLGDVELRDRLGAAARRRIVKQFDQKVFLKLLNGYYADLIDRRTRS